MNNKPIEETYDDVKQLVYSLAWKIKCCDQCTFEDRLSVAMEAFVAAYMKYRPDQGASFSTWVYINVRNALLDARTKCISHSNRCKQLSDHDEKVPDLGFWQRAWESLSVDAYAVVVIIVSAPEEVVDGIWLNTNDKKGMVRSYLAAQGYSMSSLTEVFSEISCFLQEG